MNNDSFLIEEFDLDIAKDVCRYIKDPSLRNKATANVAAASFAKKYFQDYEIDIESGLHNIAQVLEDIDISDIYIKNNYIDVRLYFNDNELFVPKSHFDNNILPIAYMFIKIGEDLSNGIVTGFILPEAIDTTNSINGYYHVNEKELISFYDVESNLMNMVDEELPTNFESQIFDYLDDKLSDKQRFYSILLKSKEARIRLQNAAKAKTIFSFISIPSTDTVIEETAELLEETQETLEALEEFDSDFSFSEEPTLEEFNEIEGIEALELEETDTLTIDDSEPMGLDIDEETIEPIESADLLSDSIEEDISIETAKEDEVTISQDVSAKLDSFDTNSIQMLDTANYEKQAFQNITSNEIEVHHIQEEQKPSIDILNSSSLIFDDESPALEIVEQEVIENPVVELTISDESGVESETENKNFDFATNVTPSLDTFEEIKEETLTDLEEELLNSMQEEEIPDKNQEISNDEEFASENTEQIDTLFKKEENTQEVVAVAKTKPKSIFLPIIVVVTVLTTLGYYSYAKFANQQPANDNIDNTQNELQPTTTTESSIKTEVAMPVESVENVEVQLNPNEESSVSIPAIEQNIDASITVSNLHVEFEIPAGYKASKTAERYFTKIGKILQVNLKTELLLLSKQPVTNKIAVELEFNKATQKFEVKGLVASSGEKIIDDLILNTVKNALNINLNMNMNIFGNVAGNPVLVIKL